MTKIGIIDERECFGLIQDYERNGQAAQLEPEYFLAPNPTFLERMINFSKGCYAIILHRIIWLDECRDQTEHCLHLDTFEKAISPIPLLKVGKNNSTHASCPGELLNVFTQVKEGYERLGGIIGVKVQPPNSAWKTNYLTIKGIEVFGDDNFVGTILEVPDTGATTKYFKLSELNPYLAH